MEKLIVTYSLTEAELVRLSRFTMQRTPFFRLFVIICGAGLLMGLVAVILNIIFKGNVPFQQSPPWILAMGGAAGIATLLITSKRAAINSLDKNGRLFKNITCEISSEGIKNKGYGFEVMSAWSDFKKWKELPDCFLITLKRAPAQPMMLPKRVFANEAELAGCRKALNSRIS